MSERKPDDNAAIYLVGGGIASLAAAAFFIRDGDIPGRNMDQTLTRKTQRPGWMSSNIRNEKQRPFPSHVLCLSNTAQFRQGASVIVEAETH